MATGTIRIHLNGEPAELPAGLTLSAFLDRLGREPRSVAIERNGRIAPRSTFGETILEDGDRLEIVGFVQGG